MAIKNWKWRNMMKVRTGDRVEWKHAGQKLAGSVMGFDNRSALITDDDGGHHIVPARELTVVEKRAAST